VPSPAEASGQEHRPVRALSAARRAAVRGDALHRHDTDDERQLPRRPRDPRSLRALSVSIVIVVVTLI